MSELLFKVCPLLPFYFSKEGLSATVANARKNENTNENVNLTRDLQKAELYETHLTIISDKDTQVQKMNIRKLLTSDFDVLNVVAKNNAENAILGNGIKIFNFSLDTLKNIAADKLVEFNGEDVTLPKIEPLIGRKSAVTESNVDSVLQMERVEDIVSRCQTDVLLRLDAATIKKALKLESEAATLGNELTKKDCFLQRVISAEPELISVETVANFAMVIKQPKLAYTYEEVNAFKNLFEDLQKRYQNLQGQLNGIKKSIKDTIRLIDTEYAKEYGARLSKNQDEARIYADKQNQINAKGEILRQQLIQELLTLKISVE